MKNWYCKIENREMGPLEPRQLVDLAQRGRIGPDTLVRSDGEANWVGLQDHAELFKAMSSAQSTGTECSTPSESSTTVSNREISSAPREPQSASPIGIAVGGGVLSLCVVFAFFWFVSEGGSLLGTSGAAGIIAFGVSVAHAMGLRLPPGGKS